MVPARESHSISMRAWSYSAAGAGLENSIQLIDGELPTSLARSKDGRVLIEVLSMSLNPADYRIAESRFLSWTLTPKPASPGLDFCGKLIDESEKLVYGRLDWVYQHGTLGQFVQAKKADFLELPPGINKDAGAALPTAALTAYKSIVPFVASGDRVFINGGSGGVGIFSIQIAKLIGCFVVVSCSARNEAFCKEIGADETVDYAKEDITGQLMRKKKFDLVVDNVGNDATLHRKSEAFLKGSGLFVLVAAMDQDLRGIWSMLESWLRPRWLGGPKIPWSYFLCKTDLEALQKISDWVVEGKLKVVIDEVFDFEDAPKAISKLKTGRARGKIVVRGVSYSG